MNANLEDRLRQHYHERTRDLPAHSPGLADDAVATISAGRSEARPNRMVRVSLVIGSVAAAAILGFVLINRPMTEQPDVGAGGATALSSPAGNTTDAAAPALTLPESADVSNTPVTVAGTAPTDWYRLQPDLDVAWYEDPSGQSPTMLCWRTPTDTACVPDAFPGALPLIVPTAGGQTLVIAAPSNSSTLDVHLAGGGVLNARLEVDDQIGWGVARYHLPEGETIATVG